MVEPAARKPSQLLSSIRDELIEAGLILSTKDPSNSTHPIGIWGPCLHAQKCPLSEGRDWCHFSTPVEIPGKWFQFFSQAMGSERQWVKFAYLWIASQAFPAPQPDPRVRLVVSDPLNRNASQSTVLTCEPEKPGRVTLSSKQKVHRGDLIRV